MFHTPHNITQIPALSSLAKALCEQYPRGVFYLSGDLGAGKTTFAQVLIKQLGYNGIVQSPTYGIVNEYTLPDNSLIIHADLYRLAEPDELLYLDVREWESKARYVLIEWATQGGDLIPQPTATLHFELQSQKRTLTIIPAQSALS